jgi:hypothetical protein
MERGQTDALGPVLALPTAALTPPRVETTATTADEVEVEDVR